MKKCLVVVLTVGFSVLNIFAGNALNYGHRGCRGLRPENSLPSYEEALKIGVDYVDMDINMTSDGVLVVTHNNSLNPDFTKDSSGKWIDSKKLYIKDMTFAELQTYDIGEKKPGTKYFNLFPEQRVVPNTKIPSLIEVIHYVKENAKYPVKFQIEMKCMPFGINHNTDSITMANALYRILKEENIIDITEVQSFDWTALITLNSLDKNIKTAYLMIPPFGVSMELSEQDMSALKNYNYSLIGVDNEAVMQLNYSDSPQDAYDYFARTVKELGGALIEPMDVFATEEMKNAAHKYGLKYVVWSSPELIGKDFDYELAEKMINMGVDGIITDRPDLLKEIIRQNSRAPLPFYSTFNHRPFISGQAAGNR